MLLNFIQATILLALSVETVSAAFLPAGTSFGGGSLVTKTPPWNRHGSTCAFFSRGDASKLFIGSSGHNFDENASNFSGNDDDHLDMDELEQRIDELTNPHHDVSSDADPDGFAIPRPKDVHIILFNPDTDSEGVHTVEFPEGSGNNIILAFESGEDCVRFATKLKQQEFFDPSPQEINLQQLEAYCDNLGVFVQVIPAGMSVIPPTDRVENLTHNPELRHNQALLDYLFEIGEFDPDEEGVVVEEVAKNDSWA